VRGASRQKKMKSEKNEKLLKDRDGGGEARVTDGKRPPGLPKEKKTRRNGEVTFGLSKRKREAGRLVY